MNFIWVIVLGFVIVFVPKTYAKTVGYFAVITQGRWPGAIKISPRWGYAIKVSKIIVEKKSAVICVIRVADECWYCVQKELNSIWVIDLGIVIITQVRWPRAIKISPRWGYALIVSMGIAKINPR